MTEKRKIQFCTISILFDKWKQWIHVFITFFLPPNLPLWKWLLAHSGLDCKDVDATFSIWSQNLWHSKNGLQAVCFLFKAQWNGGFSSSYWRFQDCICEHIYKVLWVKRKSPKCCSDLLKNSSFSSKVVKKLRSFPCSEAWVQVWKCFLNDLIWEGWCSLWCPNFKLTEVLMSAAGVCACKHVCASLSCLHDPWARRQSWVKGQSRSRLSLLADPRACSKTHIRSLGWGDVVRGWAPPLPD